MKELENGNRNRSDAVQRRVYLGRWRGWVVVRVIAGLYRVHLSSFCPWIAV